MEEIEAILLKVCKTCIHFGKDNCPYSVMEKVNCQEVKKYIKSITS